MTKKMNQEEARNRAQRVMKNAHTVAHEIVRFVGDYQIALSIALKISYKYDNAQSESKNKRAAWRKVGSVVSFAYHELTPDYVAGVPTWAIKNDFASTYAGNILHDTFKTEITEETEKAVKIVFYLADQFGKYAHVGTWVAKSIMKK